MSYEKYGSEKRKHAVELLKKRLKKNQVLPSRLLTKISEGKYLISVDGVELVADSDLRIEPGKIYVRVADIFPKLNLKLIPLCGSGIDDDYFWRTVAGKDFDLTEETVKILSNFSLSSLEKHVDGDLLNKISAINKKFKFRKPKSFYKLKNPIEAIEAFYSVLNEDKIFLRNENGDADLFKIFSPEKLLRYEFISEELRKKIIILNENTYPEELPVFLVTKSDAYLELRPAEKSVKKISGQLIEEFYFPLKSEFFGRVDFYFKKNGKNVAVTIYSGNSFAARAYKTLKSQLRNLLLQKGFNPIKLESAVIVPYIKSERAEYII
ncbi:MAG: hypothetical protein CSB55_03170 [Candidatus Cloacimonadota bacterium]|nr:MAG: hypothetical protein CSB55_03170 [Candidatus Cloacimonadota bacterium]